MNAHNRVLADTYMPRLVFSSYILVDPMIVRAPRADERSLDTSEGAAERKSTWRSREEAFEYLKTKRRHIGWDKQVLRLYTVRTGMSP